VAKDAVDRIPPMSLCWMRISLSFLVLLPIWLARTRIRRTGAERSAMRRWPGRADAARLCVLGLLAATINQVAFLNGIKLSSPLHGALLYAFTPAIVLLAAVPYLGEKVGLRKGFGLVLALVGVVLVLTARGLSFATETLRGDLLILLAVFSWAGYTLLAKPMLRRHDPLTLTTWVMGFAVLSLLPFGPWMMRGFEAGGVGWRGWGGLLYLSVMTSGVAYVLWNWALRRMEAGRVAIYTNFQPPLVALLAWWFRGELPTGTVVMGGLLVLAGVTLVQMRDRGKS